MRRPHYKRNRILYILFIILAIGILIFIFIDRSIKPTVISWAEVTAHGIATSAMNQAVKEILGTNIKYTDLVNVLTDKDGRISMIQVNTVKMNNLAAEVSKKTQELINAAGRNDIYIPLGSVFNNQILAGHGPKIPVQIETAGIVSYDYSTEFQNAGINQTRHIVYLIMNTSVRIIIPFGSDYTTVSNRMPITETIIVGNVPNSYVNVDETDKMLNLIPNNE